MWKICIWKILNVNLILFSLLTSANGEFSTSNFAFVISYLCKKKMESHVFVLSIFKFVWKDLAIACKIFNRGKSVYWSLEFNEWTEAAIEEGVLQI